LKIFAHLFAAKREFLKITVFDCLIRNAIDQMLPGFNTQSLAAAAAAAERSIDELREDT
jgi:hypothetical protein